MVFCLLYVLKLLSVPNQIFIGCCFKNEPVATKFSRPTLNVSQKTSVHQFSASDFRPCNHPYQSLKPHESTRPWCQKMQLCKGWKTRGFHFQLFMHVLLFLAFVSIKIAWIMDGTSCKNYSGRKDVPLFCHTYSLPETVLLKTSVYKGQTLVRMT